MQRGTARERQQPVGHGEVVGRVRGFGPARGGVQLRASAPWGTKSARHSQVEQDALGRPPGRARRHRDVPRTLQPVGPALAGAHPIPVDHDVGIHRIQHGRDLVSLGGGVDETHAVAAQDSGEQVHDRVQGVRQHDHHAGVATSREGAHLARRPRRPGVRPPRGQRRVPVGHHAAVAARRSTAHLVGELVHGLRSCRRRCGRRATPRSRTPRRDVVLVHLEAEAVLDDGDQLDQGERVELGQAAEEQGVRRLACRRSSPEHLGERLSDGRAGSLPGGARWSRRTPSFGRCHTSTSERRRVAEEGGGAGGEAVGAGLEEDHEVADLAARQAHLVAEQVQRACTGSRPPGPSRPPPRLILLPDRDRVVAADDLAEVARGGELVVHAAVDDQEGLAAGHLAVDDPGDVDAGLADDVAAELEQDPRVREGRTYAGGASAPRGASDQRRGRGAGPWCSRGCRTRRRG